jgi:hypothetical protein
MSNDKKLQQFTGRSDADHDGVEPVTMFQLDHVEREMVATLGITPAEAKRRMAEAIDAIEREIVATNGISPDEAKRIVKQTHDGMVDEIKRRPWHQRRSAR